ncbi:sterol binding ankyrin repeat protein [Schizosaccharomyces cryophilus OY26]|uniref:Sterol binding ankyrin repeat protein n=1 Tax=Schizosaccharomyces cryophilus (strain OY26 / ATCC MYA-4695 / CBS 11777 / NBRC 106824 / NRRL Y48691) TaxID=653667 RepID=S9XBA3_SCHCR|nr:sterol binding ankyrin repeat protein [Schizosaccharomyces cryophilus OY26]EPY51026.1 sterol binding ankyrin repeat protein [Schizosaccharomyces cryophilus OY26]
MMETVEVRSKSLLIQWLNVKPNSLLSWQIYVKRKSIKYDIYYKRTKEKGSPEEDYKSPAVLDARQQQQTHETEIRKLNAAGLELFYHGERCMAEKPNDGSVFIEKGGLFAFVFDNTFSKTTPKIITFLLSTQSFSGPVQRNLNSKNAPKQLVSGTLLKKRRKKGQGYARRYFTLDMLEGTLSYYANPHSSIMRGKLPLSIAVVSVSSESHEINVDSGIEVWNLRAHTHHDWLRWCNALERAKNTQAFSRLTVGERSQQSSSKQLDSIYSRLRECLDIAQTYRIGRSRSANNLNIPNIRIQLPDEHMTNSGSARESIDGLPSENSSAVITLRKVTRQLGSLLHELECFIQHHEFTKEQTSVSAPSSRVSMDSTVSQSWYDAEDDPTISHVTDALEDLEHSDGLLSSDRNTKNSDPDITFVEDSLHRASSYEEDSVSDSSVSDISSEITEPEEPAQSSASTDSVISSDTTEEVSEESEVNGIKRIESLKDIKEQKPIPFKEKSDQNSALGSINVKSYNDSGEPNISNEETELISSNSTKNKDVSSDSNRPANELYPLPHKAVPRRQNIPAIVEPPPSILSVLRKNIGKDISSIRIPVVSNEPCSLLQRYAEDLEYSDLLDTANESNPELKIFYVAAFAVSNFSNMRHKERSVRKVFSPLLGETYELVREDKNYRFLAEKVSHRPLVVACQADSPKWKWHHSPRPIQKFWGKSIELNTHGDVNIQLNCGHKFVFTKPACFLKNVAIGEKYVEPYDHMVVTDSTTGDKAIIQFKVGGMFSGRSEEVFVKVIRSDGSQDPRCLTGKWTTSLELVHVETNQVEKTIWQVGSLVKDPHMHCGMTLFAAQMNEITPIEDGLIPPTDTRLRPDQRLREQDYLEEAEPLKLDLEQKQRELRQEMEKNQISWLPRWFSQVRTNDKVDDSDPPWLMNEEPNNYWACRQEKNWSKCPQLW